MFHVSITDRENQTVKGSFDLKAAPAEYFAACIYMTVDLLNGGPGINQIIKNLGSENHKPFSTTTLPQSTIPFFLGKLHEHPAFTPEILLNKENSNFHVFKKIFPIMYVPLNDTSTHIYFLELLSQMQIEGIKSIQITDDFTRAQRNLYICNFPDELIPQEYLCSLTSQVMDTPCFDKRNKSDVVFDEGKIKKHIEEKHENPYTKQPMSIEDLAINEELKDKINNFMAKVILIPKLFPDTYNDEYQKRKADLQSTLLFDEFKEQIEVEMEKHELSEKDKISIRALTEKEQTSNPVTLYQRAIGKYKEKAFAEALVLLEHALVLFQHKTGKTDSEPCFKCHSTIVSCHRELKNYDAAITCAEQTIINFLGKIDISSLLEKYEECLKLRGYTPKNLYKRAVDDYKAKQYFLALPKLALTINLFNFDTEKAELAYCCSTLASCYRGLERYDDAITYCEKALELRKTYLKDGDKLIQDTEKKLAELKQLLLSEKSSIPKLNKQ